MLPSTCSSNQSNCSAHFCWVSREVLDVNHTTLDAASKSHGPSLPDLFYVVIYKVQKDIATGKDATFWSYICILHISYLFGVVVTLLTLFPIAIREQF